MTTFLDLLNTISLLLTEKLKALEKMNKFNAAAYMRCFLIKSEELGRKTLI